MTASAYLFERMVRAAPLGVRFWDTVVGAFVRDGLAVAAYPADNPSRRVTGFPAGSGTFAFQGLPGLLGFELANWADDPWATPPAPRSFVVEVVDGSGRFLPWRFTVGVPHAGIFVPGCLLADMATGGVPLFSTAGRVPPGGMAVIRAELRDAIADAPAAWAVVEVHAAGVLLGRGIADQSGKVVVVGPYPAPPNVAFDSPATTPVPLTSQTWPVTLAAWYAPAAAGPVPGDPRPQHRAGPGARGPLGRHALLAAYPGATLSFGSDLVARLTDHATGQDLTVLLLTPSGSPI